MCFPLSNEPGCEDDKEALLAEIPRGKGERILIVEDNQGILGFVRRVLANNGCVGFGAASIKEAL